MNIEFMEGFLETARHKSIAKASERLMISHPALSKQIRAVEAYYGTALFKRSSTGVELTKEGEFLFDRMQPLIGEWSAIKSELGRNGGLHKLALGTLPSLAANYLPDKIMAIERKQVIVEIAVRNTSHELYVLLQEGAIDAALLEKHPVHRSYWTADLYTEPYFAVVPAKHRFFGRASLSVAELDGEPLILNPPDCNIRRLLTELMAEKGMEPHIRTQVNYGDFILGYVAAGAGISIVPKVVADHIANPELGSIPLEEEAAWRTISLVALTENAGKFLQPFFQ